MGILQGIPEKFPGGDNMKRGKRTNYNDLENMDHAEKKFYGDQMKEMGCKGFVLRDIWDVLGPYLLIIVAVISLLVGILIGWSWRASRDGGTLAMENPPEQATDAALTTEYRAEIPPEGTTPVQTDTRQTTPVLPGKDSPTAPVTTVPEEDQTEGLPNEPENPNNPTPARTTPRQNPSWEHDPGYDEPDEDDDEPASVQTSPRQTTPRQTTPRRTTPAETEPPVIRTTAAPVRTEPPVVTTAAPPAPVLKGLYVSLSQSGSPTRVGSRYSTTFRIRLTNTAGSVSDKQKLLFTVPSGTIVKEAPDGSSAYVSGKYLSITSGNEIQAGKSIYLYVTLEADEMLKESSIVLSSAQ